MNEKRNVLLALTTTHHGFYRGVARYARKHNWHLVTDMLYATTIPDGWHGDGIISHELLIKLLPLPNCPGALLKSPFVVM